MHQVALIPGDWIGPEAFAATRKIISALGVDIDWVELDLSKGVTEEVRSTCESIGVILKGRLDASPVFGQLPPTIALRKELGLWSTVRSVKPLPGVDCIYPDIDLIVVRETSEDIYSGFEHEVTDGVVEAVKVTTRAACERISRFAFETARAMGRKKVTIVHKSNIMKKSDGMFLSTARSVASEYPDIEVEESIVDALCMWLVKNPMHYDVLLTLNLFGDIVSDLCSGLAGGVTASPSVSYGDNLVLFEVLHGRAPELVGRSLCNPIPMLNVSVLLLRHLNEGVAADRLQRGIVSALESGVATPDLGGQNSTEEMVDAIIAGI